MKHVPDNEIRAEIRSLLVRHRADLWRLQVRVTNGVVRINGDLVFLRGSDPTPPSFVEHLERSLNCSPGVKRASLDVTNWVRGISGEWQPLDKVVRQSMAAHISAPAAA